MSDATKPTTIITLELDPESHQYFEGLRQQHYPAKLNQIAAHLTLFHKLPGHDQIVRRIERAAHRPAFALQVTGLRSLGGGVAFTLKSAAVMQLHHELADAFKDHLTPQDRQPFWPHVVIQNKVSAEASRGLLAQLQNSFQAFEATAVGLAIWNYLGGPWERIGFFNFR